MLELAPTDPIVRAYLKDLQHLKNQDVVHELGLRGPFQTLLDKAAKKRGWTLVPELSTSSGGKRVVPDGTVRDQFRLARGWWEAKDTSDHLAAEIQKKLKAGYPTRNIIFEDTRIAVLYQDRGEAGEFALTEPVKVAELLNRFLTHDEGDEREFERAMQEFKNRIPDLAQSLGEHIQEAHQKNRKFKEAFAEFVTLCRASLKCRVHSTLRKTFMRMCSPAPVNRMPAKPFCAFRPDREIARKVAQIPSTTTKSAAPNRPTPGPRRASQ